MNSRRIIVGLLWALLACSACASRDSAYVDSITRRAVSPDERHVAIVIRRWDKAALSNDVYVLDVMPATQTVSVTGIPLDVEGPSVLIATGIKSLVFHWRGSDSLDVTCHECRLEQYDYCSGRIL